MNSRVVRLAASTALLLVMGTPAFAQSAPNNDAGTANDGNFEASPDIVVTARRREEALSRVPLSISALSQDQLNQRSIRSIDQLAQSVPGLTFGQAGGSSNPQIVIRGQDKANIGEAPPPVVTYFADVPMSSIANIIPAYDLASIQVLKGPQGTLFGRNTTGGAVLLYPVAPTYQFGGYLSAGLGNYYWRQVEGAVNIPIVEDHVAVRLAGQRVKRDGYTKVYGQEARDNMNDTSFRASLLLEFGDLKSTTVYDYVKWNRSGDGSVLTYIYPTGNPIRSPSLAPTYDCNTSASCDIDSALALQKAAGIRQTYANMDDYLRTLSTGLSNTTTLPIGNITLKNVLGYRLAKTDNLTETDGTYLSLVGVTNSQALKQFTEEFQVQGDFFDGKLQTIAGAFYLRSLPNQPFGQAIASFSPPSRPSLIASYRDQKSKALFGAVTYDASSFIEGLKFDAGLRHTWDSISACTVGYAALFPFRSGTPLISPDECRNGTNVTVNGTTSPVKGSTVGAEFQAWTWSAGLSYQASKDVFLYFTTRRGYRAGGVNTPIFSTIAPRPLSPYQSYSPETNQDFEVGAKVAWNLGGIRGNFNLDVYTVKYKNTQRQVNGVGNNFDQDGNTANDPSGGVLIINAGTSRVNGFDLDTNIFLTPRLTFRPFVSVTDWKYLNLGIPLIFTGTTAFPATAGATAFRYAPKFSTGANIRYEAVLSGDAGKLAFNFDGFHTSRIWFNPFRDDLEQSQGPKTVFNGRIDWEDVGGTPVTWSIFGRNLFNTVYKTGAANSNSTAGFASMFFSEPRMYGVEAKLKF